MVSRSCLRDQGIEDAHQHAAREADLNAACARILLFRLASAISQCIHHNGEDDQKHSAKEQQRASLRGNEIVQQHAHHQRQSNSDWKRDGKACNIDCGNQQQVCYVEDHSAEQREDDMSCVRTSDIAEEG